MNKNLKFALLALFIGVSSISYAQIGEIKFGKILKEDLAAKVCRMDTSANAEVLYDRASSNIDYIANQLVTVMRCHKIIKIYNKNGYEYANVELPYNNRSERISVIKACTYNLENDKIVKSKLNRKDILEEKVTDNYRIKKVSFHDIKEGSIIEIEYRRQLPLRFDYATWYFQARIPVRYSEYVVRIPDIYEFKKYISGYETVSRKFKKIRKGYYNENVFTYFIENVPAFVDESFIECRENYITKIDFELATIRNPNGVVDNLTSSWNTICGSLVKNESFGEVFKKRAFLRKLLPTIISDTLDDDYKVRKIFNYVRDSIKWNEDYSIYSNDRLKRIAKKKSGNSAGVNLLLIALLREAGYECNPVILSTRSNGIVRPGAPNILQYNHTIACLQYNDKKIYLDAIDKYSSFDLLSNQDSGHMVLIKNNRYQCFHLDNDNISRSFIKMDINIDQDGVLKGSQVSQLNNFCALGFRKGYDTEKKRIEALENKCDDFSIDSYSIKNLKNCDKSISEEYEFCYGEDNDKPSVLYIPALLQYSKRSNPFKLDKRIFPVDLVYKEINSYNVNFKIPDNYTVQQLPKSINVTLPDKSYSFRYSCNVINNTIVVNATLKALKTMFLPKEYALLKSVNDIMVKKFAEHIVLKIKE